MCLLGSAHGNFCEFRGDLNKCVYLANKFFDNPVHSSENLDLKNKYLTMIMIIYGKILPQQEWLEVLGMKELNSIGDTIYNYGVLDGKAEGMAEGKKELLLNLLKNKSYDPSELFQLSGLTKEEFDELVNITK
jgi:hypothetical protein